MNDLLNNFFKRNNLDINNKKFCIAVSTGVDSSVLLDLFIKNKNIDNNNIIVCHVNHHKRAQSEIEEKYIINYCQENNIKLYVKDLYFDNSNDNFQSKAREERYTFFKEIIEKEQASYLVLAHHLQDLSETIIMRIIRGSSLAGYAGIKECYQNDNYYVIRPLIDVTKEMIYDYAKINNITYFEDSSNDSLVYTRNKIRHEVIPRLMEINPDILNKLREYSLCLFSASNIINEQRDKYILDNIIFNDKGFWFYKDKFISCNDYMQKEILFELLKPNNLSDANIMELLKIIHSKKSNFNLIFKNKFEFIIEYNKIIVNYDFQKELDNSIINNVNIVINNIGTYNVSDKLLINVIDLNQNEINNLNELWYNSDKLPLTIRNRKDGDKILLKNGYKKVKDILIELKVPLKIRDELLLAVDKDGEVLCIFGIRKSYLLRNMVDNDIVIKIINK